jgi:sulfoxide reductase heme-binding subunit YedZ
MGGKNWQRLHRLVYLAGIAACIHYWWLVKTGVLRPLPDTLVLAGLLLARVAWEIWNKTRSVHAARVQRSVAN